MCVCIVCVYVRGAKLTVLVAVSGVRGSTPLDVAASSCIDNNELALALQEQDLEMVSHLYLVL